MITRRPVLLIASAAMLAALVTTALAIHRWPAQDGYYVWVPVVLTIVWPVIVVQRTFRRHPPDAGDLADACLQLLASGGAGITLTMLLLLRCLLRAGS